MTNKRILDQNQDQFEYNAWDDVEFTDEYLEKAKNKIETDYLHIKTNHEYDYSNWEIFFAKYRDTFFKDRKWILRDYSILFVNNVKKVYEIGCGVGNSLAHFNFDEMKVMGCDVSKTAIEIIKKRFKKGEFEVINVANDYIKVENVDRCMMIYTLSAIQPSKHSKIIKNINNMLSLGGIFCFRDYGEMDMVQLRYKNESIIEKNFYQRCDGTYTYFFNEDELRKLIISCGFEIIELNTVKKLLTNRKRQLKMYRVYLSGIFKKIKNI